MATLQSSPDQRSSQCRPLSLRINPMTIRAPKRTIATTSSNFGRTAIAAPRTTTRSASAKARMAASSNRPGPSTIDIKIHGAKPANGLERSFDKVVDNLSTVTGDNDGRRWRRAVGAAHSPSVPGAAASCRPWRLVSRSGEHLAMRPDPVLGRRRLLAGELSIGVCPHLRIAIAPRAEMADDADLRLLSGHAGFLDEESLEFLVGDIHVRDRPAGDPGQDLAELVERQQLGTRDHVVAAVLVTIREDDSTGAGYVLGGHVGNLALARGGHDRTGFLDPRDHRKHGRLEHRRR